MLKSIVAYRITGDVVAEFDVGTGNNNGVFDSGIANDYDDADGGEEAGADDDYERCRDRKSKITLFPLDNFDYPGNDPRQRPLVLAKEVFQV